VVFCGGFECIFVFFLVTWPDRAAPALFLCSLAHPDRSLLTMAVSIYFMRLYFFAVLVSSVLPLNRTVVFWGIFLSGEGDLLFPVFFSHIG